MHTVKITDCIQRRTLKWSACDTSTLPAWVAETDFALAPPVAAALHAAIDIADVGYPPKDGDSPLGSLWSDHFDARFELRIRADEVFSLPGAVTGLYAAIMAFTARGEGVVVTPPVYKPFLEAPVELGRRRLDVPLVMSAGGTALDLNGLAAAFADGGRLLLLCHPHNPTGAVFDPAELKELGRLAAAHGTVVVSDEVHAPLISASSMFVPYAKAADAAADAVTLVSMSKAFSFAGLKCGAAHVGRNVRDRWVAVPRRLRSGCGLLGQIATEAALSPAGQAWLATLNVHLDEQRDLLAARLPAVLPGARLLRPDAGYLAWLDLREAGLGDVPAETLLQRGVRLSAGEEFGPGGEGHARLNFATSTELLHLILDRLADHPADEGITRAHP